MKVLGLHVLILFGLRGSGLNELRDFIGRHFISFMSELKCKQMQLLVNKYMCKHKYLITIAKMFTTYSSMLKIKAI